MFASHGVNILITRSSHEVCGNLSTVRGAILSRKETLSAKPIYFNDLPGLHRALVKAWKGPSDLVSPGLPGAISTEFSAGPVENSVLAFSPMARERILLIEDEPDIAEVLQYNLEKEGFQVDLARRADTGLEMVRKEQPDLILLDLMLPGVDGLEVTRLLKRDPA